MKVEDFDFYLPEKLIAQTPLDKRDSSKLLVLDKKTGDITHKHFTDIIDYLEKGDTLVKYATAGLDPNIFVQKYMIQLPSEEEIKNFISKEIEY